MLGAMSRKRRLKGKKLLVAAAGLAATSLVSCGDDTVANLVAPPEDAAVESGPRDSGGQDANMERFDATLEDAPVANIVLPPDSGK